MKANERGATAARSGLYLPSAQPARASCVNRPCTRALVQRGSKAAKKDCITVILEAKGETPAGCQPEARLRWSQGLRHGLSQLRTWEVGYNEKRPPMRGALFIRSTLVHRITSVSLLVRSRCCQHLFIPGWAPHRRPTAPAWICYSSWRRSRPVKTKTPGTSTAMPTKAAGINSTGAKEPEGDVAEKLFRVTAVVWQSRSGP